MQENMTSDGMDMQSFCMSVACALFRDSAVELVAGSIGCRCDSAAMLVVKVWATQPAGPMLS